MRRIQDADELARQLVKQKKLTRYQAEEAYNRKIQFCTRRALCHCGFCCRCVHLVGLGVFEIISCQILRICLHDTLTERFSDTSLYGFCPQNSHGKYLENVRRRCGVT